MKNNSLIVTSVALALALALSANPAFAGGDHGSHGKPTAKPAATAAIAPGAIVTSAAKEMTAAEVRKVDAANLKITLKHSEIKSIDMPAMTMVFTVKDKAALEGLSVGDKVEFALETSNGKFTITDIKKAAP